MTRHNGGASVPPTALGYARVSTDEQAREGVSLEAQQSRIRAYCEAKDLELVDVLVDDGISGKTLERPALRELVARCERGEVGNVLHSHKPGDYQQYRGGNHDRSQQAR